MKKAKVDKFESCTELCLFVRYPKETKGGYFYSPKDNKVFVSTNARFLEDDHIRNHKSNKKVVLDELDTDEIGDPTKDQNDEIIVDERFHYVVVVELLDNQIVIWELKML